MKIGDYNLKVINTGLFRLDGGAMFGVVPKTLWSRTNPPDNSNRIDMCTKALMLDNGKRKILIDTGVGTKLSRKLNDIYAVDFSEYNLLKSLKEHNIERDDVTDVILTHLHFDHAGGCTFIEDGELKITFPNAVHYVQAKHFEWACNPSVRDKASFINDNFDPLFKNEQIKFVEGDYKFDESINLFSVNGHTRNMQIVKISDDNTTLLFLADLIPMASHIPLPYIMGYDLMPLLTLEEKRNYLEKASAGNWLLFFEHDPSTEIGIAGFDGNNFFLKDKLRID